MRTNIPPTRSRRSTLISMTAIGILMSSAGLLSAQSDSPTTQSTGTGTGTALATSQTGTGINNGPSTTLGPGAATLPLLIGLALVAIVAISEQRRKEQSDK